MLSRYIYVLFQHGHPEISLCESLESWPPPIIIMNPGCMGTKSPVPVTCRIYAMFVFSAEIVINHVCSKSILIFPLEKVKGCQEHTSVLQLIKENEKSLEMTKRK